MSEPTYNFSPTGQLDQIQKDVTAIFEILNGAAGTLGMSQKVAIMWRAHVWLVFFLGNLSGSVVIAVILKSLGLIKIP